MTEHTHAYRCTSCGSTSEGEAGTCCGSKREESCSCGGGSCSHCGGEGCQCGK